MSSGASISVGRGGRGAGRLRLAAASGRVIVRVCAQHAGLRISRASEMMSILGGTAATVVEERLQCLVGGGEGDREHTAD